MTSLVNFRARATEPAVVSKVARTVIHAQTMRAPRELNPSLGSACGSECAVYFAPLPMLCPSAWRICVLHTIRKRTGAKRLADGTYGTCERCGLPISRERLAVLPVVRRWVQCRSTSVQFHSRRWTCVRPRPSPERVVLPVPRVVVKGHGYRATDDADRRGAANGAGGGEAPAITDLPIGEVVGRLSDDTARLDRDEIRLAQAEMTQNAKAAGLGTAMFSGAEVCGPMGLVCRRLVLARGPVVRHAHRSERRSQLREGDRPLARQRT